MSELNLKEVDERIHDKMEGPLARIEAAIDLIEYRLGNIDEHMKTANHATAKNVDKIEEVKKRVDTLEKDTPHSVVNCPQNGTLIELKNYIDNLKGRKAGMTDLENRKLTAAQERRARVVLVFQIIGVVIASIALAGSLIFGYVNLKKNNTIQTELNKALTEATK